MKKTKKAAKAKTKTAPEKHENLIVVNDLNDMAVFITQLEGKTEEVNIAQVKEILSVVVQCVRAYPLKTFEILCQAAMKR